MVPPMKRLLKRLPTVRRLVRAFRRASGADPCVSVDVMRLMVRVGDIEGGWFVAPDLLGPQPLVCSIGIGDDPSFDQVMVRRFGAKVVAFDPSPGCAPVLASAGLSRDEVTLFEVAVADFDGPATFRRVMSRGRPTQCWTIEAGVGSHGEPSTVETVSIVTALRQMLPRCPQVLKVDAEGSEYRIIDALLAHGQLPPQLLIEFHHRLVPCGTQRTIDSIAALRRAGYQVAAISELGSEYTFIRGPRCAHA